MRKHLPFVIAVFVLAFLVYSNSIRNDFNFDDITIIKNNSLVRLSNLPKLLVSNYWANTPYEKGVLLYRPLPVATFALDRALWGDNPAGFHLTNVLINAADAALVFVLLAGLFRDRLSPVPLSLCALLFAFHPVHTEAINMVVGRTELLAALFGLLTFICYLHDRKPAAFGFFFLALLSKESAVTIPAVIFLYEYLFKKRVPRWSYVIFAGIVAALSGHHGSRSWAGSLPCTKPGCWTSRMCSAGLNGHQGPGILPAAVDHPLAADAGLQRRHTSRLGARPRGPAPARRDSRTPDIAVTQNVRFLPQGASRIA